MKKKSALLIIIVMLAIISVGMTFFVFAEDVIQSGTWGDLSWSLNETTGELVIRGEGEMDSNTAAPWLEHKNKIKAVVIEDGVTSISSRAFENCINLSSIDISDSVTKIGFSVFAGCAGLTEITIPDTCTDVWDTVFWDCPSITSITIPGSAIKSLEYLNGSLKTLTITSGTEIPQNAFYNQGVETIIILDGVTSIGERAFSGCGNLKSLRLPDTVTYIGDYAFENCVNLEGFYIPEGVTYIGNRAFYRCYNIESVVVPETVTQMGFGVFDSCQSLSSVVLPDSLTKIDDYMFQGCQSLTSIEIPANVTVIEDEAFSDCTCLTEIIIPDGVIEIGNYAFRGCMGLKKIIIPNSIQTISGYAFASPGPEMIVAPIGAVRFFSKENLKTVVLTNGNEILENTFVNCTKLENVFFCGTREEWNNMQRDKKWLSKVENVKFSYHDCSWEIEGERHVGACLQCGADIEEEHTWDKGTVTKPSTHLESGIKTFVCTVCVHSKTETIEKSVAHKYGQWINYSETQHKKTCECGEISYENHIYINSTVITPSTEQSEGTLEKACVCGAAITEAIPALTHEYDSEVIKPTCTDQGYTKHTCKNCDDVYNDTYVNATGHVYDSDEDETCNKCDEKREIVTDQLNIEKKESGCNSSVSGEFVIMALSLISILCFTFKKKKEY